MAIEMDYEYEENEDYSSDEDWLSYSSNDESEYSANDKNAYGLEIASTNNNAILSVKHALSISDEKNVFHIQGIQHMEELMHQNYDNQYFNPERVVAVEGTGEDVSLAAHSIMSVNAVAKLKTQTNSRAGSVAFIFGSRMPKSASTSDLPRQESVVAINQKSSAQEVTNSETCIAEDEMTCLRKPEELLFAILKEMNVDISLQTASSLRNKSNIDTEQVNFFATLGEENIAAYTLEIATAIRSCDVETMRSLHKQGKTIMCCNKFFESVMHTTCRYRCKAMLSFLLNDAKLPINLCDESGRNPLHDACWTSNPDFDCIAMVLDACPDLLYIKDNRGFTPLSYVPTARWNAWCEFLIKNKNLVKPRKLL